MSRWLALLRQEETGGMGTDRTDKSPSVSFVSAVAAPESPKPLPSVSFVSATPARVWGGVEGGPSRLRRLATVAGCPVAYVDRLHPIEVAEYAHFPDADAVASLRHLAGCRQCRERQCRPVACATCARYLPDVLNPEAGMGQCSGGHGSDGPPTFPNAPRHCQAWRPRPAASDEPEAVGRGQAGGATPDAYT